MGLTYGDLVPFDKQIVFADIVYLVDIYYVRTMHLDEGLAVYFLFKVLDGIVCNVLFVEGHKLYIIAHAFNKQYIIIV